MYILSGFDERILRIFQSFSNQFYSLTGKTNNWLAIQMMVLMVMMSTFTVLIILNPEDVLALRLLSFGTLTVIWLGLVPTLMQRRAEELDKEAIRRMSQNVANPYRSGGLAATRIVAHVFLLIVLPFLIVLAIVLPELRIYFVWFSFDILISAVLWIAICFLACDPPSAERRRFKDWIAKLLHKPETST